MFCRLGCRVRLRFEMGTGGREKGESSLSVGQGVMMTRAVLSERVIASLSYIHK